MDVKVKEMHEQGKIPKPKTLAEFRKTGTLMGRNEFEYVYPEMTSNYEGCPNIINYIAYYDGYCMVQTIEDPIGFLALLNTEYQAESLGDIALMEEELWDFVKYEIGLTKDELLQDMKERIMESARRISNLNEELEEVSRFYDYL